MFANHFVTWLEFVTFLQELLKNLVRYLSVQVRNPFKEIWNIQQHWGRIGVVV